MHSKAAQGLPEHIGNYQELVQALHEHREKFNTRGGEHYSALQVTSRERDEDTVQVQMEERVDNDVQKGSYNHPVQAASQRRYGSFVDILLSKGSKVNITGDFSDTTVQAASLASSQQILQILAI
ncbi:unnamed protein product [Clonostachys rosea]|uniref:Uncharacterized protein n=1 Tax=Bionectria ochroleuca TaxID=29856 RepID=A0ABY6V2Z1_BIOOC|nr:unnamed protein product [Clonostachys rosea]